MPKFTVAVRVWAVATYEVEVEASSEKSAEGKAVGLWRDQTPPEFQVDKIDGAECEAEQLTWECEHDGCGKEISYVEWSEGGGYCYDCARESEAA